jgi:hypothetical protein
MDGFDLNIVCKECGSSDVHICKHIDYTGGLDDATDYTNDIVLVWQSKECYNRELIKLQYEIVY